MALAWFAMIRAAPSVRTLRPAPAGLRTDFQVRRGIHGRNRALASAAAPAASDAARMPLASSTDRSVFNAMWLARSRDRPGFVARQDRLDAHSPDQAGGRRGGSAAGGGGGFLTAGRQRQRFSTAGVVAAADSSVAVEVRLFSVVPISSNS